MLGSASSGSLSPAATSGKAPVASPLLRSVARVGMAGTVLGVATLAYGRFIELNNFTLRHEVLPVLPEGSPDFRILHISDTHMIPGQKQKKKFLHSLAALEPDLVMNTGDNLSHLEGLADLLDALDPLMDFPGVFVPGSNCYFAPIFKNPSRYLWQHTPQKIEEGTRALLPFRAMHEAFESRGWVGLINRFETLKLGGLQLEFSGVDDPHLNYDEHPGFSPGAFSTETDLPQVHLGVAHAPYMRTLHRFVTDGAQAIFAGHTHGGQICLPGGRALATNCDLPNSRAKGVSYQKDIPVHISAGLGTSRFTPVRLFCPPEAVLVTLSARTSAQ